MKLALAVVLCAVGYVAAGCQRPDEDGQALWTCDLGETSVWVEREVHYEQIVELSVSCEEDAPPLPCDLVPQEAASPAVDDGTVTLTLTRCQTDLDCLFRRLNIVGENFDTLIIKADIPPPVDVLTGFELLNTLKLEGIYEDSLQKTIPISTIYFFQNLTSFSMNKGQFTLPSEGFRQPSTLIKLELTNGGLTYLPPGVFQGLQNLRELDLSGNQLSDLNEDVLEGLSSLEELKVSSSGLRVLGDLARLTPQLKTLVADHNELQAVPAVAGLQHLTKIMLGNNKIRELAPNAFADLPSLKEIFIETNRIGELPANVFQNSFNIETLYFLENDIDELPAEVFWGLSKLDYIQFNANRLRTLPPGVFQDCTSLKSISMNHNQLSQLSPEVFRPLRALEYLQLDNNELEEMPDNMFNKRSKLTHLNLSNNMLRRVAPRALAGVTKLKVLKLAHNQLTTVYTGQGQTTPYDGLNQLQKLDLSHNRIQDRFRQGTRLARVSDFSDN